IRYGGLVEGSWDVTRKGRVLSLGLFTMFADPLGSQPVPFTELVSVGGTEPFAGFLNGRLRGRSAIAAQLSLRWPVFVSPPGVRLPGRRGRGRLRQCLRRTPHQFPLGPPAALRGAGRPHRRRLRQEQLPDGVRHGLGAVPRRASADVVPLRTGSHLWHLEAQARLRGRAPWVSR